MTAAPHTLASCPHCGHPAKHVLGGVSKAGKQFTEFWVCDNPSVPCTESRVLSWKSHAQWQFLADQPHTT